MKAAWRLKKSNNELTKPKDKFEIPFEKDMITHLPWNSTFEPTVFLTYRGTFLYYDKSNNNFEMSNSKNPGKKLSICLPNHKIYSIRRNIIFVLITHKCKTEVRFNNLPSVLQWRHKIYTVPIIGIEISSVQ